jgi:hypothetical protein
METGQAGDSTNRYCLRLGLPMPYLDTALTHPEAKVSRAEVRREGGVDPSLRRTPTDFDDGVRERRRIHGRHGAFIIAEEPASRCSLDRACHTSCRG